MRPVGGRKRGHRRAAKAPEVRPKRKEGGAEKKPVAAQPPPEIASVQEKNKTIPASQRTLQD